METITCDLRGIPDWVLEEYLVKLGGIKQPGGYFLGQGWRADITRLPDYFINVHPAQEKKHIRQDEGLRCQPKLGGFCQFRVEFRGEAEILRQVYAGFALRIMRPGG